MTNEPNDELRVIASALETWDQAQADVNTDQTPDEGWGQAVKSIRDDQILSDLRTELPDLTIERVREILDAADGTQLVIGRDGESRTVKAPTTL